MRTFRAPVRVRPTTIAVSFTGATADLVACQQVHDATEAAAESIARIARSTAVNSALATATTVTAEPGKKDRAQHIVRVAHPAASRVEWGTSRQPGKHTLGRAVEAAGFDRKGGDR